MIALKDIRDWLKSHNVADNYYIGRIDANEEKVLGVYTRVRAGEPVTAIDDGSSYNIKGISLLFHWNRNASDTEQAVYRLWEALKDIPETLSGKKIHMLKFQVPEPVPVDYDDTGIYEYVIDFDIYYRR